MVSVWKKHHCQIRMLWETGPADACLPLGRACVDRWGLIWNILEHKSELQKGKKGTYIGASFFKQWWYSSWRIKKCIRNDHSQRAGVVATRQELRVQDHTWWCGAPLEPGCPVVIFIRWVQAVPIEKTHNPPPCVWALMVPFTDDAFVSFTNGPALASQRVAVSARTKWITKF